MADHAPFDVEEIEVELLERTGDRMVDQALLFDPALTTPTNLPPGTIRLNRSARKLEKLESGGSWVDALDYLAMKVNELTNAGVLQVLQKAYPVGSIYSNADVDTNPNTLLGFGTWTAIGSGRVLVGQDTGNALFDVLGETGGSADAVAVSHSHTINDPGHVHSESSYALGNGASSGSGRAGVPQASNTGGNTTGISINSAGVSGTNKNLQPYLVVKIWKRTA
jgi:hypothetical protein